MRWESQPPVSSCSRGFQWPVATRPINAGFLQNRLFKNGKAVACSICGAASYISREHQLVCSVGKGACRHVLLSLVR